MHVQSPCSSGVNLWKWLGGPRLTDFANLPTPIFFLLGFRPLDFENTKKKSKNERKKEKKALAREGSQAN